MRRIILFLFFTVLFLGFNPYPRLADAQPGLWPAPQEEDYHNEYLEPQEFGCSMDSLTAKKLAIGAEFVINIDECLDIKTSCTDACYLIPSPIWRWYCNSRCDSDYQSCLKSAEGLWRTEICSAEFSHFICQEGNDPADFDWQACYDGLPPPAM